MESKNLTRAHLETLSSADLILLAEDFGIDIPDNLNRSFIIGELLEVAEELKSDSEKDDDIVAVDLEISDAEENIRLPESYNETSVCAVLRNPAWIFAFWDIKALDVARLSSDALFKSLCLRISFWEHEDDLSPVESFDIQIGFSDRQQYVLLSPGRNFVRVDLIALYTANDDEILSISRKIELPKGSKLLNEALPGREIKLDEVTELSNMRELLTHHFENHRQSFL